MEIRQEQPKDYKAVYHLVQQAFSQAEHQDGNEQDLVEALRKVTHLSQHFRWSRRKATGLWDIFFYQGHY